MAKGRGGLGRGLESLFEDAAPSFESDTRIETLPLREIEPDPGQPRKTFDDETLAELSASIAEHGLLQPIAVRPQGLGGYSIVAGPVPLASQPDGGPHRGAGHRQGRDR